MDEQRVASILGYGLFGLGIGLTIFSLLYLVLMRAGIAERESTTWLLILLAMVLVPAVIGAGVGAARGGRPAPPAPY